jgi:protein-S-isoprenylcysteine O-methyltransferase Ste14
MAELLRPLMNGAKIGRLKSRLNPPPTTSAGQKSLPRVILRILPVPLILMVALFIPAGTWDFWQGWAYIACHCAYAVFFVVYFHYRDPQLLARRMLRKERVGQQKVVLLLLKLNFALVLMLGGFDHRLGWSQRWLAPVPAWLTLLALALIAGCQFLFIRVMIANRFAASVIQVEASQTTADTGPYRFVRHPMYAVGIAQNCLTPLALGSFIVWPMFVLIIPILVWRLLNEEKVLRHDLSGYAEYCKRTRYRLVPRVW